MPNHQVPIEQAELWDILDWDITVALSVDAVGDPRDQGGQGALAWTAKLLIDASAKTEGEAVKFFHRIVRRWVTGDSAFERRQQAADLALLFGARPDRLVAYIAYKWGLLKPRSPGLGKQ